MDSLIFDSPAMQTPRVTLNSPIIFDSHAHYDDRAFDGDREAVLSALPGAGVCGVINCGVDILSSQKALALAAQYPFLWAAVGLHGQEAGRAKAGLSYPLTAPFGGAARGGTRRNRPRLPL